MIADAAAPAAADDDDAEPLPIPTPLKVALGLGVLSVIVGGLASINLQPDLGRLDATLLSGAEGGHYHSVGERLGARAAEQAGTLKNVATAGTVENVQRLVSHAASPTTQFALVQDGLQWTAEQRKVLRLVARLPTTETVFFLGKDAGRLKRLAELAGMRVGIGPAGSGTAQLARHVLEAPAFAPLKLQLINGPVAAQLDRLAAGELDLALIVIHEDAALIRTALLEKKLQAASFPEVEALAHRAPFLRAGRLHAGHYDPVARIPASPIQVLQVDTLVCGDGSASRSETIALLQLLEDGFPGLLRHNQALPNGTGLRASRVAAHYFERGGPDPLDEYFPWIADWVPLSNLLHIVMAVSILFNLLGAGHRFVLWRIDTTRIRLEGRWTALFGARTTPTELEHRDPTSFAPRLPELTDLAGDLQRLKERCRKLSVSALVPMGKELSYRYQESLINERLGALRAFADRVEGPGS